jgi:hypothetical protein
LLFSNCDRHEDNFLFRKEDGITRIYGIDHYSCMCFDNRPLKIKFLNFTHAFDCPFVESVKNLVSEENIERYTGILTERKADLEEKEQETYLEAIEWMIFVG